jgi:hypothetical protein
MSDWRASSLHRQLRLQEETPAATCEAAGVSLSGNARMQLGEIIANLFAALLLACVLGVVFFFAAQPIWPDHHKGKIVILMPADAITTGSIKATTHPHLPNVVDGNLVRPRPPRH